jgi:hypothetical protein
MHWYKPAVSNHIQMNEFENQQINLMCCDTESGQANGDVNTYNCRCCCHSFLSLHVFGVGYFYNMKNLIT